MTPHVPPSIITRLSWLRICDSPSRARILPFSAAFYYPTEATRGARSGRRGSSPDCNVCGSCGEPQETDTRMKIDIYNHIFPKAFFDKYIDKGYGGKDIGKRVANIRTIVDVDARLRILD